MKVFLIYVVFLAAMSLVTMFVYLADKIKAKKGKWRIRESVLLGLSFVGGATGALFAMKLFRHKTKHWYFWVANVFFVIAHLVAAIFIYVKFV